MTNDIQDRVIRTITHVLKLGEEDVRQLGTDVGYKRIAKWTSARHAEIIVALEDEFGIEVEERAIPRLSDVARIVAYVEGTKR